MNSPNGKPNSAIYEIYNRYKKLFIAFLLIIFLFVLGELTVSNFFSLTQILLTIKMASITALFGLCQMLVISSGGNSLDLSVGYTATITAVLTASIMDGKNGNLWLAVLIAVGLGIAVGFVNGILTAYFKLPALVVTLAMANILQGIINVYTAGRNITGKPSPILTLMAAKSTGIFPNIIFTLLAVATIVMILIYKTKWGLMLFGVGSNEIAAQLSGVNVKKVRCGAFIIDGLIASLIGLLLIGNMGIAFKDMGSNYVLPSIAAVVIGGVSLSGGDVNGWVTEHYYLYFLYCM